MSGGVQVYRKLAGIMLSSGAILLARCVLPVLAFLSAASPARAQATPSLVAPNAYNAQPGTVPVQVATGVFNNSGGLLDFAVLEQIPDTVSYQVEIFHGAPDGSFCTNCSGASPNPDLIPLGSGVTGNAIAVGQFLSSGPLDIVVATSTGIDFLENNGSGTFTLNSTLSIASPNGFVSLAVGLLHGDGNYDIAAVAPAVSGIVSFTVFFGNGARGFTPSASYPLSNTYYKCTAMMQGNFQSQTNSADLALECNNPSFASVLVYLNSGSGAFTFSQTLSAGSAFAGVEPGVALGVLGSQAAIFIASQSNSFVSFQSNGSTGGANAFTSVSMIPVGEGPHGAIAVLDNPLTGAVDFDVNGVGISTFTSYSQSGTSVNGTWNSTAAMGPGGVFAAGFSPSLTQGAAYVMVDASVGDGEYTNFYPFLEERSINVFLVTFNADGTVASTNAAPIYSGTGENGYSFPPSFATGDFTGLGKTDLAVTGADLSTGDATLTIYLANPDGSLPATTTTPASVVTVSNTDYAGADAVVAGKFRTAAATGGLPLYDLALFSFGQIFVLPSNGDGTFGAAVSYSLSGDPNYPGFRYNPGGGSPFAPVLIAADVNGDGLDDIVLTLPEDNCNGSRSLSQGAVYVLISNGDGTFQSPVFIAPPVMNPVSAVAAGFYGRAVPDLAIADGGELCSGNTAATTGTEVGILQNNVTLGSSPISAGNFTSTTILTQGSDLPMPDATAVATADLNGDGKPDLVVSDASGIHVLLNQGGGSFLPTTQGVVRLYAGDQVPGPLCMSSNAPPLPPYVGCVNYVSQVATGSFFAVGENDVAASVNGVAYIFQNQGLGKLSQPAQGFVAGPDSAIISAAPTGSNGLNGLLVATSQGTAYLANGSAAAAPSVSLAPSPLPFGSENMGTTSAPLTVTLTNTGTANLILSTVTVGGTNSGDFAKSTDSCTGATVTSLRTCTVDVTFTPSATGSRAGTLSFTDNASNSPQTLGLTGTGVCQPITVGPSALAPGTVGVPYGQVTFTETGGLGAITFSETGLPNGIGMTFAAGILSGTPVAAESVPITVTATDSNSCSGNITDTLTINPSTITPASVTDDETINVSDTETFPDVADAEKITVTDSYFVRAFNAIAITPSPASFNAANGTGYATYAYSVTFAATGGIAPLTLTESGTLPTGITFVNGVLSGTPAASSAGSSYTFSVIATDADGDSATLQGYTLTIQAASAFPASVTDDEIINVSDTETFPDVADAEKITVTDSYLVRAFNAIAITPSPASFNASDSTGFQGANYGPVTFTAMGGIGTLTLTETGTLPAGLTLTNGVLGGTLASTSAGTYTFNVTATDADGDSATLQGYTLTIQTASTLPAVVTDNEIITVNDAVNVRALAPAPAITSITPDYGLYSGGETVVIAGQNFQTGATVLFGLTPATSVTVNSATSISVVVPALNAGSVSVTVTNPDGQSATGAFTALLGVSGILNISPASGERLQTLNVALTGGGFRKGMTVTFGSNTSGITVNSVTVTDPDDAIANITIASNAPLQTVPVTVISGKFKIDGAKFTVQIATLSISPTSGEQRQTFDVALTGGGFVNGVTTAQFGPANSGIKVNSVTVTDPDDAIANITIASNAPQQQIDPVTVTTGSVVLSGAKFNVRPLALSINPTSGEQRQTFDVAITGDGFVNGVTTARFGGATSGIKVNSVTVTDPDDAIANITIAYNAPQQQIDPVTVTTGSVVLSGPNFKVRPLALSISPTSGEPLQTFNVALTGGGFVNGVTTARFGGVSAGIRVNFVTVTDPDDAIANITIAPKAPLQTVPVTVTTGNFSLSGPKFTVQP